MHRALKVTTAHGVLDAHGGDVRWKVKCGWWGRDGMERRSALMRVCVGHMKVRGMESGWMACS